MNSVKSIRALARGLEILRCLERQSPQSLHALARQTDLPKATLLRILLTLEQGGFIRRGLADQLYHINLRSVVQPADGWKLILAEIAGYVLDRLCQEVSWPSDIGIYEDGSIFVQETSRRQSPFLLNRDVLSRRIHVLPSAMGRAFLAWSSKSRQDAVLADLAKSGNAYDRLSRYREKVDALLAETRDQGYGLRHKGYAVTSRREARISAIALPVCLHGTPIGAVNLAWVQAALTEREFASRYLSRLRGAAEEIGSALDKRLSPESSGIAAWHQT